jgi:hypothetical protein
MRREIDSTRFAVKDLADQCQCKGVLSVQTPFGAMHFQADRVHSTEKTIIVYREGLNLDSGEVELMPVVTFPVTYQWVFINQQYAELGTVSEWRAVQKLDLVDRMRAQETIRRLLNATAADQSDNDPYPPPPEAHSDDDGWLRRQLGDLDGGV